MALLPLLCRHDAAFVDVGAAFGFYTWFAARYAGSVHAFEPLPELAATLRAGFRGGNVQVHACALSHQTGAAELRVPRANIGFATIEHSNQLADKADTSARIARLRVAARRLDDVVSGPVSCLKIDVEGHELEVLRGAERTLRRR